LIFYNRPGGVPKVVEIERGTLYPGIRGTQYVTIDPAGQAWYDDDMPSIARVVAPCAG